MELNKTDFDYIRDLVRQRSAIVLGDDKSYLVEYRLQSLARHEGFDSLRTLLTQLGTHPHGLLPQKVVEALAINETSFFRDRYPFESLKTTLLPNLIRQRVQQKCLNIWAAACSTGQEAYSIAMILSEFRTSLAGWNVRLLASDISTAMLQRAEEGIYSAIDVSRGLPTAHLKRHFHRTTNGWQIRKELSRMVEFLRINLIEPWPPLPQMDIIFLRNVLIYFDVPTKKRILANVRRALRPDGYLFLGTAETTLNIDDAYERMQLDQVSCYRLRE
jgi:chemotaxis protein methyltransferase CheR